MRNRGKRLAAILGAAALVVCQNGVMEVKAEEAQTLEESLLLDAASDEKAEETQSPEKEAAEAVPAVSDTEEAETANEAAPQQTENADADENMERAAGLKAAENLDWQDNYVKGYATFTIPNEKGTASYKVSLWRNGEFYANGGSGYSDLDKGEVVELFLFHSIKESGTYKVQVATLDPDGNPVNQAFSSELEFEVSAEELPVPANISWNEEGIFSCDRPDNEYFLQYSFVVFDQDKNQVGPQFGSPVLTEYVISENEEGITFRLNEFLEKEYGRAAEKGFFIFVQSTTRNLSVYKDSKWSNAVFFGNASFQTPDTEREDSSSDEDSEDEEPYVEEAVYEEWKPVTADEIKRYAVYSKEKAEFAAAKENAYPVTVSNAMQGKQCFDSFEAVLGDWAIGRTYNILPNGKPAYRMDSKARIALNIPGTLQKEGREFKMICVTEKGLPVILNDVDTNPETITFETDTYYAFALVYKDAAAK